jgi:RHS repeat-associated protein
VPTDKLFTGQRLDATGLYYYNARYYDATIGRFISPDSIIPHPYNPQSFNRYSYCLNNPLKYIDPSGHDGVSDYWAMMAAAEKLSKGESIDIKAVDQILDRMQSSGLSVKITYVGDNEKLVLINHSDKSDSVLFNFTSSSDGSGEVDWGRYNYRENYDDNIEIWQKNDSRAGPEPLGWGLANAAEFWGGIVITGVSAVGFVEGWGYVPNAIKYFTTAFGIPIAGLVTLGGYTLIRDSIKIWDINNPVYIFVYS